MHLTVFLVTLLICVGVVHAQGTRAEYERAANVAKRFENKVARERIDVRWIDADRCWYAVDVGEGKREFVLVDAKAKTRGPLFDVDAIISWEPGRPRPGVRGGDAPALNDSIDVLGVDGDRVVLFANGKSLIVERATNATSDASPDDVAKYASPTQRDRLTSRDNGPETSLLVVNRLDRPVELFWVTADGDERPYGAVDASGQRSAHTYAGHAWHFKDADGNDLGYARGERRPSVVLVDGNPATQPVRAGPSSARRSGRGRPGSQQQSDRFDAFVRDHDLCVRDRASGETHRLTTDGSADHFYELKDFDGDQTCVSPDGMRLVALKTRAGKPRTLTIVEHAPTDQLQPKLRERHYDKPGDPLPVSKPVMFRLDTFDAVAIDEALFPNPWAVDDFHWWPDKRFSFSYNERGHRAMRVVTVDPDGKAVATIDEPIQTFFDYAGGYFLRYLDDAGEVVWMSERDGWRNLYLIDAKTGDVKRRLNGDHVVRGVERVGWEPWEPWEPGRPRPDVRGGDARALDDRSITFRVGGIHAGQDPYHVHFARVDLDTGKTTVLTDGDGTHEVEFSPDGRYVVDRWSRVDLAPVTELRSAADGSLVMTLEKADDAELVKAGWPRPERFVAKGRDGATDIHGVIWRPSDFDAAKKYPVVEQIYAGPQGHFAPKSFRAVQGGAMALAELGFIVVQCDGMGTNGRHKAFHDVAWRNLKDAGFADRIAWMRAAAKDRPWMDLSRVGIYGGSAGGQNAMRALLDHGDFYDAAFADCGCHDNRMDKVWWNELWMGHPVDDAYLASSNAADAHKLQGKLMLSVGMLDDNVDPSSTFQVVQALIDADKDYELLVFPRGGHGAGGSDYGRRRMWDFFIRHLGAPTKAD